MCLVCWRLRWFWVGVCGWFYVDSVVIRVLIVVCCAGFGVWLDVVLVFVVFLFSELCCCLDAVRIWWLVVSLVQLAWMFVGYCLRWGGLFVVIVVWFCGFVSLWRCCG